MRAKPALFQTLCTIFYVVLIDFGVTGLFNNGVGWLWLFIYTIGLICLTLQIRKAVQYYLNQKSNNNVGL